MCLKGLFCLRHYNYVLNIHATVILLQGKVENFFFLTWLKTNN